jgi:hypothetical protein
MFCSETSREGSRVNLLFPAEAFDEDSSTGARNSHKVTTPFKYLVHVPLG